MIDFEVIDIDINELTDDEVIRRALESKSLILRKLAEVAESQYHVGYEDGHYDGYDRGYEDARDDYNDSK